jgi:predicted ArsR family transcriptional regulator
MSGIIVDDVNAYVQHHITPDVIDPATQRPLTKMTGNDWRVLEHLAEYAAFISRCACPAVETIAQKLALSHRTVQRALRHLVKHKLLEVVNSRSAKYGTILYRLLVPRRTKLKRQDDKLPLGCNPSLNTGKERKIFAHAHVPEEEIRQKTAAELAQLAGKDLTERFRRWLGLSPTGAVQAILDEN